MKILSGFNGGGSYDDNLPPIRISPDGRLVAVQMAVGREWIGYFGAPLVIMDVGSGKILRQVAEAMGAAASWMPDSRRLVYVAPKPISGRSASASESGPPEPEPVITLLDIRTGSSRPLAVGGRPIVATDGSYLLYETRGDQIWRMALPSGRPTRAVLPRQTGHVVAAFSGDVVMYVASASPELPMRWTFDSGPTLFENKMECQSIRLARNGSKVSELVVPYFDRRDFCDWGPGVPPLPMAHPPGRPRADAQLVR